MFMLPRSIKEQSSNFLVLQPLAQYEGTRFTLLIDYDSTHSFISTRCIGNVNLREHLSSPFIIELATRKHTKTCTLIREREFSLGEAKTLVEFCVLHLGVCNGISGMDWLVKNTATLQCKEGILTFRDIRGQKTSVSGDQVET